MIEKERDHGGAVVDSVRMFWRIKIQHIIYLFSNVHSYKVVGMCTLWYIVPPKANLKVIFGSRMLFWHLSWDMTWFPQVKTLHT